MADVQQGAFGVDDFDAEFYRHAYADLADLDDDGLLLHWITYGRHEGRLGTRAAADAIVRDWSPEWDPISYWLARPDIGGEPAAAAARALAHWVHHGRGESESAGDAGPLPPVPEDVAEGLAGLQRELRSRGLTEYARLLDPDGLRALAGLNQSMVGKDLERALFSILSERCPILCEPATWHELVQAARRGMGPLSALATAALRARDHEESLRLPHNGPSRWWLLGSPGQYVDDESWAAGNATVAESLRQREALWPEAAAVGARLTELLGTEGEGRPLVSVIVSVFRGGQWIRPFMEAMAAQSLARSMEVVVVDANSPDFEADVVANYDNRFGALRYIRTETRVSIYEAWNIGVQMSAAPFITNANLDDFRHSRSIELQAFVLADSGADVVYQDYLVSLDGPDTVTFEEVRDRGFLDSLPPATPRSLLGHNYMHNAPMWRRAVHDAHGLFDPGYASAGDWEFWLRCHLKGVRSFKSPYVTTAYYVNPLGMSTSRNRVGVVEGARVRKAHAAQALGLLEACQGSTLPVAHGSAPEVSAQEQAAAVARAALGILSHAQGLAAGGGHAAGG